MSTAFSVAPERAIYVHDQKSPATTGVVVAKYELRLDAQQVETVANPSAEFDIEEDYPLEGFTEQEISELQNAYIVHASSDEGLTPHGDLMRELFGD